MNALAERSRLSEAAAWYDSRRGMSYRLVRAGAEIVLSHATGPRLLELGCANGVMTEFFVERLPEVTVVEGAAVYAETARRIVREPGRVHCCLFEEFQPKQEFEDIVLAGVLEHVEDPVGLLARAAGWLAPQGRLHLLVPNALSLHRRIGVVLGLLTAPRELHADDRAIGHRRVYDWELLESQIAAAGLQPEVREGNFLKLLSNRQMGEWGEDLLGALQTVGRGLPELAAEIYVQCHPAGKGGLGDRR